MNIRRAKFQYDCFKKYDIEKCDEKKFDIYVNVNIFLYKNWKIIMYNN